MYGDYGDRGIFGLLFRSAKGSGKDYYHYDGLPFTVNYCLGGT